MGSVPVLRLVGNVVLVHPEGSRVKYLPGRKQWLVEGSWRVGVGGVSAATVFGNDVGGILEL